MKSTSIFIVLVSIFLTGCQSKDGNKNKVTTYDGEVIILGGPLTASESEQNTKAGLPIYLTKRLVNPDGSISIQKEKTLKSKGKTQNKLKMTSEEIAKIRENILKRMAEQKRSQKGKAPKKQNAEGEKSLNETYQSLQKEYTLAQRELAKAKSVLLKDLKDDEKLRKLRTKLKPIIKRMQEIRKERKSLKKEIDTYLSRKNDAYGEKLKRYEKLMQEIRASIRERTKREREINSNKRIEEERKNRRDGLMQGKKKTPEEISMIRKMILERMAKEKKKTSNKENHRD